MKLGKLFVVVMCVALCACSNQPTSGDESSGAASAEAAAPKAPPVERKADAAAPAPVVPAVPKTTVVPAGTAINVTLIDAISSEKNQAGDQFTASLSEPLIVNGKTIAEKGTKVQGRIV